MANKIKKCVIPDLIKRELERLDVEGIDWCIKEGGRHMKIFVKGKFCGILSKGKNGGRQSTAYLNVRSQIRRAALEQFFKGEK